MYIYDDTWRKVQAFIPYENRIRSGNMPIEGYIQMDNINMHIDYYGAKKPKATNHLQK